jgi:hypothetical protein
LKAWIDSREAGLGLSETGGISVLLSVCGKSSFGFHEIVLRKANRQALDVWLPGRSTYAIVGDLDRNVERSLSPLFQVVSCKQYDQHSY